MKTELEILKDIIIRLKKDNTRSCNEMKNSGKTNWDIDKTRKLVELYLDSVVGLFNKELTEAKQISKERSVIE